MIVPTEWKWGRTFKDSDFDIMLREKHPQTALADFFYMAERSTPTRKRKVIFGKDYKSKMYGMTFH